LAKKYYREALNKDPDNTKYQKTFKNLSKMESTKNMAGEAFKLGDFDEAINLFSKCLELDPLNKTYNCAIFLNRSMAY
jgi:tetratricopeptide (TPR) repeat protein